MLTSIFQLLDQWINDQNNEALRKSFRALPQSEFRVVGQTAILEANLDLHIGFTDDVDAFSNAHYSVLRKLNDLLIANGLEYDFLSNEIWMPSETKYVDLFRGDWVIAMRAEPEFVMVSKAKLAMNKNRILLRQYIGSGPP